MSEPAPRGDRREDGLTLLVRNRNDRAFLTLALRAALEALDRLGDAGFAGEVLVVDDASLDGSPKLLRNIQAFYDEPRLRTLCLDERHGPGRLRELGLRIAAFRYVCVTDAADELEPANVALFLRSILDTGAAMAYGNLLDKKGLEVAGFRSNVPIVPALPKIHGVDASLCVVDVLRAPDLESLEDTGHPEGWKVAVGLLERGEKVVFVPAIFGYRHGRSAPAGSVLRPPARRDPGDASLGRRRHYPESTPAGRTYHPDVGFLDV